MDERVSALDVLIAENLRTGADPSGVRAEHDQAISESDGHLDVVRDDQDRLRGELVVLGGGRGGWRTVGHDPVDLVHERSEVVAVAVSWSLDFIDLLASNYSREEARAQLDTAIDWGHHGELFEYDAAHDEVSLHLHAGAGASLG